MEERKWGHRPQLEASLRPAVGEGRALRASLYTVFHQPSTNPGMAQSLWETEWLCFFLFPFPHLSNGHNWTCLINWMLGGPSSLPPFSFPPLSLPPFFPLSFPPSLSSFLLSLLPFTYLSTYPSTHLFFYLSIHHPPFYHLSSPAPLAHLLKGWLMPISDFQVFSWGPWFVSSGPLNMLSESTSI